MASSKVLKNRLVSNLLSRVAVPLRPAGVPIRRFSTIYDDKSVSLTTNVTKPRSFKREDAESIHLYVDMPGVDIEDDKVTAIVKPSYTGTKNGRLCIEGKALEKDYECECRNYFHGFDLPENVKATEIKACMGNGVLKLTLPKTKEINKDQKMIHEVTIVIDYDD